MTPQSLSPEDYQNSILVTKQGVKDKEEGDFENLAQYETLTSNEHFQNVLITPMALKNRVKALAIKIGEKHQPGKEIHALIVLTGAFIFASDLFREIYIQTGREVRVHLIKTSTYADDVRSSLEKTRDVEILLDPMDVEDRNLLIVEDLVDQSFTLNALTRYLREKKQVKSVETCVLLNKQLKDAPGQVKQSKENLNLDYQGFLIPDVWVAGYGIDASHRFRQLPFVISVKESTFL